MPGEIYIRQDIHLKVTCSTSPLSLMSKAGLRKSSRQDIRSADKDVREAWDP